MVKVKICGLTRAEDIDAVNSVLPDYIGFVFAPSRRRIDRKTAAMLKERLDPRIKAVGVFVNQDFSFITGLKGIIDIAQLHGDEDGGFIRRVGEVFPVIKAVGVGEALPVLPEEPDYLIFDSPHGGSGKCFDWTLLKGVNSPYFLAGGLNRENVSGAIKMLGPFCVDVSGGVETDGFKDVEKIEKFVKIVRGERIDG